MEMTVVVVVVVVFRYNQLKKSREQFADLSHDCCIVFVN